MLCLLSLAKISAKWLIAIATKFSKRKRKMLRSVGKLEAQALFGEGPRGSHSA